MGVRGNRLWIAACAAIAGCSGAGGGVSLPDSGDGDDGGACGEVSSIDLRIVGTVVDEAGSAVAGVAVVLEERNWTPGTVHGSARSDAAGTFAMDATGLPVVEDCWGTAVQFWLEGTRGDLYGEKPMNPLIIDAWLEQADVVELGDFPLVLDD